MFLKNNKTFYLIFLFVVISIHTYILTSVLSVSKNADRQVKVSHIIMKDSLGNKNDKFILVHSQLPFLNNGFIISTYALQK